MRLLPCPLAWLACALLACGNDDARAKDGPSAGPSVDGPSRDACLGPGTECTEGTCCAEHSCVVPPGAQEPLCAAECSDNSECNSDCCLPVRGSQHGACALPAFCAAAPSPTSSRCTLALVAENGTFLGVPSSSAFAADGVCNAQSQYGSAFGAKSIFNEFGTFGSDFSQQSAYNQFTRTPPALVCNEDGGIVAFVTKNRFLSGAPRIDPDALCTALARAGR